MRSTRSWSVLIMVAVLATMLGSAYVGFQWAGHTSQHEEQTQQADVAQADEPLPDEAPAPEMLPSRAQHQPPQKEESFDEAIRRRFGQEADSLLPRGITQIEGRGGKGAQRQVKAHGAWYPVFDLSSVQTKQPSSEDTGEGEEQVEPDSVELAEVQLSIVSPAPPRARVGSPWTHTFQAVGGQPPYVWAIAPSLGADFTFSSAGVLQALAEEEVTTQITVTVTDSAGESASTPYPLVVLPAEPLVIVKNPLPSAAAGLVYSSKLTARGGVQPYAWALVTSPSGLALDSATGLLSGTVEEAVQTELHVEVTDAQGSVAQASLPFSVTAGVEITSDSTLLPVAPITLVKQQLEAQGGKLPYRWRLLSGALPAGLQLSPTGDLAGTTSAVEALYEFVIQVEDAQGTRNEKTFRWAIHQGLLAVPSQQCVGLAWRPAQLSVVAGVPVNAVRITRDGATIYEGSRTDAIDAPAPLGAHLYVLYAPDATGRLVPCASSRVVVLPATLAKAQPGVTADPYADRVRTFQPLSPGGYGASALPHNVTGPPQGRSTFEPAYRTTELVSLHAAPGAGGSIVLECVDNIVRLGQGLDLTVFENVLFVNRDPNNRYMEPATVEVALWEGEWWSFPTAVNPPAAGKANLRQPGYYAQGFAGINASTGENPTDPYRSGGDSFDLNTSGSPLSWIRFIRITSTGHLKHRDTTGQLVEHTAENGGIGGIGSSGFDLDAVSAVNW